MAKMGKMGTASILEPFRPCIKSCQLFKGLASNKHDNFGCNMNFKQLGSLISLRPPA